MPVNKDIMVLRIEERFKRMFPQLPTNFSGGCLYWAAATHHELSIHGLKPRVVAGSMNWLIVPDHLDDGVSPTHFSYEFEGLNSMNRVSMAMGDLPEMHVWVRLTGTNEIVDLSTRSLQEQCTKLTGNALQWLAPPAPKYLWTDTLPQSTYYRENAQASKIATQALSHLKTSCPPNSLEL